MRRKLVTIVLTCLLLAGMALMEHTSVERLMHSAMEKTERVTQAIRAGRFDEAAEAARQLDEQWDRDAARLETLVDHRATDDVRFALSRLLAALEAEDRSASLVYAGELEGGIEHMHDRQALTPQNIL